MSLLQHINVRGCALLEPCLQTEKFNLRTDIRWRSFFQLFSALPGPYDLPGSLSKIVCTGDLCPMKVSGGTWYWYTNFSSLKRGKLPSLQLELFCLQLSCFFSCSPFRCSDTQNPVVSKEASIRGFEKGLAGGGWPPKRAKKSSRNVSPFS